MTTTTQDGDPIVYRLWRTTFEEEEEVRAVVHRGDRYCTVGCDPERRFASLAEALAAVPDLVTIGYQTTVDCAGYDDVDLAEKLIWDDETETPAEDGDLVVNGEPWVWADGRLVPLFPASHPAARFVAEASWVNPADDAYGYLEALYCIGERRYVIERRGDEGPGPNVYDAGPVVEDEAGLARSHISCVLHPYVDSVSAASLGVEELLAMVRREADPAPHEQVITINGVRYLAAGGEVRLLDDTGGGEEE